MEYNLYMSYLNVNYNKITYFFFILNKECFMSIGVLNKLTMEMCKSFKGIKIKYVFTACLFMDLVMNKNPNLHFTN